MQLAAKEISRVMSKPEERDWRAAKRLARYLKDHRRIALEYKYQQMPNKAVAWSDTDFAGHGRTKAATMGSGIKSTVMDLGLEANVQASTDQVQRGVFDQGEARGEFDTLRRESCGRRRTLVEDICAS